MPDDNQTADTDKRPIWLLGHQAGQEAYLQGKGPEAPPGSEEWTRSFMRGWVFAALRDQDEGLE